MPTNMKRALGGAVGRMPLVALFAAALMLAAGCGLEMPDIADEARERVDQATSTGPSRVEGPSWSEYLPVREGRVCAFSSTGEVMGDTLETALTQKYTDVRDESDGTRFTLESTTEVSMSGEDLPPISETENLEYMLGDDGLLRSEPQLFNREGLEVEMDGFMVYPSVKEVKEGGSASSSMTLSIRPFDAEMEKALEPGESELEMRVGYKVTGLPPEEVSTPAGTFTDVIGVSVEFEDIELLNANEEARREMDETSGFITEMAGTPVVWFARDVGFIQTGVENGMASAFGQTSSVKLENCDGERPGAPLEPPAVGGNSGSASPEPYEPTSPKEDAPPEGYTEPLDDVGGDANLEEEVGDYYRAAGAEEWAYTFDHLATETRSMFTEDEWFEKNQWLWDRNPLIYHILSINSDGSSAEVELRITSKENGSSWTSVAYFILEEGEWRHLFTDAEIDLFMPGTTFDEFIASHGNGYSEGSGEGFEPFVGEWSAHGTAVTIEPNQTGTGVTRIYTTPSGENCLPDRPECNASFELSFEIVAEGGVVGTVTSATQENEVFTEGGQIGLEVISEGLLQILYTNGATGCLSDGTTSDAIPQCVPG